MILMMMSILMKWHFMVPEIKRPVYLLSPFKREEIYHLPMITFHVLVDKIDFSICDTLLFTSKQAVVSAEAIDLKWKEYPCIAIGSATKKQIEILGGKVLYHPQNFYADTLAEDITKFFMERNLLYLRPKVVSFDSKGFLASRGMILHEQIIYETSCISYSLKDAPPKNAIIIFTSPSSIKCFLKNFIWDPTYTAIVIGEATKVHLPHGANFSVADTPLIDACIAKAKELISY